MWKADVVLAQGEDAYDLPWDVIVTSPDGVKMLYVFPCLQTAEEFAEEILRKNNGE